MPGISFWIKLILFTLLHAVASIALFLVMDRLGMIVQVGGEQAGRMFGRIAQMVAVVVFFPVVLGDRLGINLGGSGTPRFFALNSLIWTAVVYGVPSLILRRLKGAARGR